ncbi:hypothetical protein Tco_0599896 [Tanacetum coccineum]
MIENLSTRMGNLEYGHGQLVKKVIQRSDVEVADGITIREIDPRVSAIEGQEEPRYVRKLSPFKMSSFGKLFELEFSKEKSVFTPATNSCASNLTPIYCMERVSCESL